MLKLPELAGSQCLFFTACGQVETEDKRIIRLLKKREFLLAKASGSRYVALFHGGARSRNERHLHVDVVLREFFDEPPPADVTSSIASVRTQLRKLYGCTIQAEFTGLYELRPLQVPAIIRKSLLSTRSDDISLTVTGGSLSVSGAPIYQIDWWRKRDSEDFRVRMEARAIKTINDSYLEDGFRTLESAFTAFARNAVLPARD